MRILIIGRADPQDDDAVSLTTQPPNGLGERLGPLQTHPHGYHHRVDMLQLAQPLKRRLLIERQLRLPWVTPFSFRIGGHPPVDDR
jgi:hypothetical protein